MRRGFPIVLAALALLSLGCEGRKPPPAMEMNLAYATNPDASLVHLALAKGFFAAEGLRVKATAFGFGKLALASLVAGEADLATAAETPLVFSILGGEEIRIIGVIATSGRNAAIVGRKSAGIAGPLDLVGKKVGVTLGTTGEYYLNSFLVAQGLRAGDMRIVDMQPGDMIESLERGRVAAVATWNPTLLEIGAVLGEDAAILNDDDIYTENFCVVGEAGFLQRNPEAARRFLRALIRAEDFLRTYPDRSMALCAGLEKVDLPGVVASFELFSFRLSLDQSLVLILEDEARWATRGLGGRPAGRGGPTNFMGYIDAEPLSSVAPGRVRLIR